MVTSPDQWIKGQGRQKGRGKQGKGRDMEGNGDGIPLLSDFLATPMLYVIHCTTLLAIALEKAGHR